MKISKGQMARLFVGIALLIVVIVIYVPRLWFTHSISAVVSAKTITLASPIAGTIVEGPPNFGSQLEQGAPVVMIENKTLDRAKLEALLIEEKSYEEKIQALKQENIEMKELRQAAEISNKRYRESLMDRLKIELERSNLKLKETNATIAETKEWYDTKKHLGEKGYVAKAVVDSAKYAYERAIKSSEQVDQEIKRLGKIITDLEKGIFINVDGRTDVPYQDQRIDEIILRQADLESRVREITSRHETTKAARLLEEKRINTLTRSAVVMTMKGTIWRTFASKGGYVDVNSPLVEIADCSNLYMDVTLSERYFDKIRPGQKVKVRLSGSSETISGKVDSVRGGSIDPKTAGLMVGDTGIHRQREIQVIVQLEEKELSSIDGTFCHIGRNGEVIFDNL